MDFKTQQKYVALAFVYWDNREYVDLLDPLMFGDYASIISVIKNNRTMEEIWVQWMNEWMMEEMIECDPDVAFHFRHACCGRELLRLYEGYIDNKFKSSKNKLDHEAVKKVNALYETLKRRLEWTDESNVYEEAQKYILMAQEKSWVNTWLSWLDGDIGWLRSGTVTRVSWYSNIGKSRFMYAVIANVLKQWKSVHVFTLEVPKGMVLINLAWAYNWVDTWSVEYWHQNEKLAEFNEKFKDKLFIEDDKMSLEQIESSVQKNDKDVVFIDYVQNIRSQGKDEYEKMTRIAQEIQKMAITTKKVFFDLSQVSNDGTKYKVGDMIPSKGTGAFVHACDIGLVLYKWDQSDITNPTIRIALAKNKFWQNGIEYILKPELWRCQFTFLTRNAW